MILPSGKGSPEVFSLSHHFGATLRPRTWKPVERTRLDSRGGCPHVDSGDGHTSQTWIRKGESILTMTPETLARTIEDFLAGARDAIVLDDGAAMFDLAQARYSISVRAQQMSAPPVVGREKHGPAACWMWKIKDEVLRLAVQRLGQTRPSKLEICRQRDRRTPTAKRAARLAYQRSLQRTLERRFPAYVASPLTTSPDLERSFARFTLVACCAADNPASRCWASIRRKPGPRIHAALTFG